MMWKSFFFVSGSGEITLIQLVEWANQKLFHRQPCPRLKIKNSIRDRGQFKKIGMKLINLLIELIQNWSTRYAMCEQCQGRWNNAFCCPQSTPTMTHSHTFSNRYILNSCSHLWRSSRQMWKNKIKIFSMRQSLSSLSSSQKCRFRSSIEKREKKNWIALRR